MDRLRALRTFIAVAEQASFAEAARRLATSPTTVTRVVAGLEQELGVPLLIRTTRTVRLTEDGAIFLNRCRAALTEIDDAFETVRGGGLEPHGTLVVTAPVMFGRLHILPIVLELLQTYPDFRVRLLLMDRMVHLVEEGIDIAVRIAEPPDSALNMVRIGEVRRVLSASPGYLLQHGKPGRASDLRDHALIAIEDEVGGQLDWRFSEGRRKRMVAARLTVNNVDAAISAAVAGHGIVHTLSYQVADHFAEGRLQQVLVGDPSPAIPICLLFQSGRRNTPNIRGFVAAARRRLGASLRVII